MKITPNKILDMQTQHNLKKDISIKEKIKIGMMGRLRKTSNEGTMTFMQYRFKLNEKTLFTISIHIIWFISTVKISIINTITGSLIPPYARTNHEVGKIEVIIMLVAI